MPKREMRLVPTQPVVGRHDRHSPLTIGTPGEAGGACAPAAGPPRPLWGVPRTTQPPAWGNHPHAAPTGRGQGGDEDGHPVLALGQALRARLSPGDGHVSLVPTGHTTDHCRHHPGGSNHAHPPASPARICPSAHCPGPWSPRDIRVRLSSHPVVASSQ